MRVLRRISRRSFAILLALVVLGGGAGYLYYSSVYLPAQPVSEPSIQTTRVRRGDLVIFASGSGTVIPASEVALGFGTSGTVAELLVEVGNEVEAGDVLARLEDSDAKQAVAKAELQVTQAEINLGSAQSELDVLLSWSPDANQVLAAQAELANAEFELQQAQSAYDRVAWRPDIGALPQSGNLLQATNNHIRAKATLDELLGDAPDTASAFAQVQLAEISLTQAQLDLEAAQGALAGTRLVAPMDGTVMAVSVGVGEMISGSFITLADLVPTRLEIFLDETDLDKIAPEYQVEVIFDALPDDVFTGRVVQVDPGLVTEGGVSTVRGVAELDESSFANAQILPVGLNAAVDVIAGRAEGVMLVPLEALRELASGEYAVFVMEGDEPVFRTVEVGLMDFTFAEILSGLEVGEIVTTGIVETG